MLAFFAVLATGCGEATPAVLGTAELRAELFDTIMARTERREAWSPVKNEALGFDPVAAMRALREDVVGAESEDELFYALERLSTARRDRHLSVALVSGGLVPSDLAGLDRWGGDETPARRAPVMVLPDYGESGGYFIADVADGPSATGGDATDLAVGDRIVSVNGMSMSAYEAAAAQYTRHSTVAGLRWKIAEGLPVASAVLPRSLRADRLTLEVERADGTTASVSLPYVDADALDWSGAMEPDYPGMEHIHSTPTYDLYSAENGAPVLLLRWYGFRETMVADIDALLARAEEGGLLDHAVIMDATPSRGGSLGPYALQRLQPQAFKTTFGTLRLSDVVLPFVEDKRADFAERNVNDGGVPETVDDGRWLMEWLNEEAMPAIEAGVDITEPVPFKLAHAPRDSDGVLEPAPVHFRGPFVLILGPKGGSHLDQVAAIVKDNDLGPIIGMPAGGYSNTWEWEEVLSFPGTDQPVLGFMWSIGHTIRPSGEILEGNPAQVIEWVPLTAENSAAYHGVLLERALAYLASVDHPTGR